MPKKSSFKEEIAKMKEKRKKAVEEALLIIEADAKLLAPVNTGTLRRSITHDVEHDNKKTTGVVGSNVEYAYFAEQKKQYLEPAVDQNIEEIKRKIAEVLNK